jgi:hypothetical protein
MVGNAVPIGLVGAIASLILYGVYSNRGVPKGAAATNVTSVSGLGLATNSVTVHQHAHMSARTIAIIAIGGIWLVPPLGFVTLVLAIGALRRTRETGEPGKGWAIGAIIVSSIGVVFSVCVLLLIWILSQIEWA